MALHGDVRVNGELIASWSAVRGPQMGDIPNTYTYDCEVVWAAAPKSVVTFRLGHPLEAGATTLAANVLAVASESAPVPASA